MEEPNQKANTKPWQLVVKGISIVILYLSVAQLTHILLDPPEKDIGTVIMMGNTIHGPGYVIEPDRINVMAFGAVGDGKTYDDEAYKAALKEVERRGLPLFFPNAHYRFHQLYFPDCNGASLEFDNSLIELDGGYPVFRPQHPIQDLRIKGMQLHPDHQNVSHKNGRKFKNRVD